jgi:hypothetical protein
MSSTVSTIRHKRDLTELTPVQTPSDAKLDLPRDWDQFLHPLVAKYLSAKARDEPRSTATSFIDPEGRFLDLGHTVSGFFVHDLLELIRAEKDDSIEIGELDRVSPFSPWVHAFQC